MRYSGAFLADRRCYDRGMASQRDDVVRGIRQQLAAEIVRSLGQGSQYAIAPSFGIAQPRMSELSRGVVDRCSVEWLIRRIERMGGTVQVTVTLGDAGRKWMSDRFRAQRAGPAAVQELRDRAREAQRRFRHPGP